MKKEYKKPCKKNCLEHKYHCAKCNTAISYSPANYASRLQDIPNPCAKCTPEFYKPLTPKSFIPIITKYKNNPSEIDHLSN